MRKSRLTEEPITLALRPAEAGTPVDEICRMASRHSDVCRLRTLRREGPSSGYAFSWYSMARDASIPSQRPPDPAVRSTCTSHGTLFSVSVTTRNRAFVPPRLSASGAVRTRRSGPTA
jgi:hypothetical protein